MRGATAMERPNESAIRSNLIDIRFSREKSSDQAIAGYKEHDRQGKENAEWGFIQERDIYEYNRRDNPERGKHEIRCRTFLDKCSDQLVSDGILWRHDQVTSRFRGNCLYAGSVVEGIWYLYQGNVSGKCTYMGERSAGYTFVSGAYKPNEAGFDVKGTPYFFLPDCSIIQDH